MAKWNYWTSAYDPEPSANTPSVANPFDFSGANTKIAGGNYGVASGYGGNEFNADPLKWNGGEWVNQDYVSDPSLGYLGGYGSDPSSGLIGFNPLDSFGDPSMKIPVGNDPSVVGGGGLAGGQDWVDPLYSGGQLNDGTTPVSGGSGIAQSGFPSILPIPGIDPLTAVAATLLLNQGDLSGLWGGGSSSPSQVLDQVGDVVSNPIGAIGNTIGTLAGGAGLINNSPGSTGMGTGNATAPNQGTDMGGGWIVDPLTGIWKNADGRTYDPTNATLTPAPTAAATQPTTPTTPDTTTPSTVVAPIVTPPINSYPTVQTEQTTPSTVVTTVATQPTVKTEQTTPSTLVTTLPTTVATQPTVNTEQTTPTTVVTTTPTTVATQPTINTEQTTPTTAVTTVPTTPTTTPTTPTVILPTPTPTTPSTTMPALPLDRNYYTEGNQTNQDNSALLPGIFGNYQNYSGGYGQTDMSNYAALLSQLAATNANLTGTANQQTAASNTALRTGNVADASTLGPEALALLKRLNPNQYGALDQAQTAAGTAQAPSAIQQLLQQQALEGLQQGGALSAQDMNQASQVARQAWGARGQINAPGAVGAEILNADALSRQRLAERQALAQSVDTNAFNQQQSGYNNILQNAQLQSQYGYNPFATVTNAQTQNVGTNQNLYGQGTAFSSGANSNQNVNGLVNPFNPYAQDVYNSNYNAGNARYISEGNNAAAIQGANTAQSGSIVQGLLGLAGSGYKSYMDWLGKQPSTSCWVARSVYGVDNPKWLLFRHWMLNVGPKWFRALYLKHGERFAAWLDKHAWLKPTIRRFMDGRIESMGRSIEALPTQQTAYVFAVMLDRTSK